MNSKLIIRPYRPSDESQVVLLVRELQTHESGLFDRMAPSSEIGSWYVSRILRAARESGGDLLVAEHDGRVLGYATLLLRQTAETAIDEIFYTFASVGDLIVTNSARRQGIGAALLAACERLARDAGEQWLRVMVLAANHQAVEIYRRHGFAPQFIDMEKPLT